MMNEQHLQLLQQTTVFLAFFSSSGEAPAPSAPLSIRRITEVSEAGSSSVERGFTCERFLGGACFQSRCEGLVLEVLKRVWKQAEDGPSACPGRKQTSGSNSSLRSDGDTREGKLSSPGGWRSRRVEEQKVKRPTQAEM